MNDLKGRFVNIVLSVEEGRGFDMVKCPFYVTASFNGRKMDSDIVEGGHVVFSTEMVWETEKKLLRKARGSYSNIRLECLTSDRKLLGFTLLCLRSAKIIPACRAAQAGDLPNTWSRLLNVPAEFKRCGLELRVFLIIRDFVPNLTLKSPMQKTNTTPHLPELPSLQFQHVRVPVRYAQEGFIQLGNLEDCTSKYQLKITLLIGSDLDVLLPEYIIFGNVAKNIYLSVELFGLDVNTRKVSEDVYTPIVFFNETIVINLQSNYGILGSYFKQFPEIKIKFHAGGEMLAWTQIDMNKLNLDLPESIFNECKQKFEMDQVCFFEGHYRATTSKVEMRRGTVSTECKLEAVNCFDSNQAEPPTQDMHESLLPDGSSYPSGDGLSSGPVQISLTDEQDSARMSSSSGSSEEIPGDIDNYHMYTLELKVESILLKRSITPKRFILRLEHPLAHKSLIKELQIDDADQVILTEDIHFYVSFVSTKARLNYMMVRCSPRIDLSDAESHQIVGHSMMMNPSRLHPNKPGTTYEVILLCPSGAEIAGVDITLFAREEKIFDIEAPTPCILDESIILHSLMELNQWQLKQREEFEERNNSEKMAEIKRLRDEWHNKTTPLQEKLLKNLEKCHLLIEQHEKRKQLANIESELNTRAEDQEYNIVMEIHKNSIKYSLADKQELIEAISDLEVKNALLMEMQAEQSMQMQELKETLLTAEQTKILLRDLKMMEQKYEIAQHDKNYFQKEYENAVKEVHNLKIDYHKNIASKIASDKQALNTFATDDLQGNEASPKLNDYDVKIDPDKPDPPNEEFPLDVDYNMPEYAVGTENTDSDVSSGKLNDSDPNKTE